MGVPYSANGEAYKGNPTQPGADRNKEASRQEAQASVRCESDGREVSTGHNPRG
jgi:hypothetical protein